MAHLLEMKNINKSFSGVQVLKNVQLTLEKGEVHALLGENGAGKSTLIKILGGVYTKDSGEIYVEGEKIDLSDVESAKEAGIRIIHQELMVIPYMTVAENIFLGQEPKSKIGVVDKKSMNVKAQGFIDKMGLKLRATEILDNLNIAEKQMVEILRAISFGAKIIVMDEPTSSLTDTEVESLFDNVRCLKSSGVGIIYISHRMSELDEIADKITVLRDGEYIGTVNKEGTDHDDLIAMMVGRQLGSLYDKHDHSMNEIILKVEHISAGKEVRDSSFELRKGEILGFSGLVGSGRTETMEAIFGLRKIENGKIYFENKEVQIKNPKNAMKLGIGFVPEDRKAEGIFSIQGIRFNASIEVLDEFVKHGHVNRKKELQIVKEYVDDTMQTKYASIEQEIGRLSGGNQQKVIISRWLLCTEKVLILDEPTRGIDVKTKSDIYHLMDKLTKQGLSIIFISSEMPELLNMCDRIVVMSQGVVSGVLDREDFSQEKIMSLATKEVG